MTTDQGPIVEHLQCQECQKKGIETMIGAMISYKQSSKAYNDRLEKEAYIVCNDCLGTVVSGTDKDNKTENDTKESLK